MQWWLLKGRFAIDEGAGKVERKLMASKVEPLTAETAAQAPAPTLERETQSKWCLYDVRNF
jgi:hypothetical protein